MAIHVRAFTDADFEQAAQIMPPEWDPFACTDEEKRKFRQADLAWTLKGCSYRIVAVDDEGAAPNGTGACCEASDGRVVGLLVGRFGKLEPADNSEWEKRRAEVLATLREGGSPAVRARLDYLDHEEEPAHERLIASAGGRMPVADDELALFVVSPDARGRGVGSALIAEFERHLAARGTGSYWLTTDDECTWQWYERHGYERIGQAEKPARGLAEYGDAADAEGRVSPDAVPTLAGVLAEPGKPYNSYVYRKDLATTDEGGPIKPVAAGMSYLPFDHDRDFDDVTGLVTAEWVYDGAGEESRRLGAALMLARMLQRSTFALVARDAAGVLMGVALGAYGTPGEEWAARYEGLAADLEGALRATDGGRLVLGYQDAELACDEELSRKAEPLLENAAEYVLFVTSPAARGKGVGAAMITRFEDYLLAEGVGGYWLFTDTGCTYDWYDRHGFRRVAMTTPELRPDGTMSAEVRTGEDLRDEPVPNGEAGTYFIYRYDI